MTTDFRRTRSPPSLSRRVTESQVSQAPEPALQGGLAGLVRVTVTGSESAWHRALASHVTESRHTGISATRTQGASVVTPSRLPGRAQDGRAAVGQA